MLNKLITAMVSTSLLLGTIAGIPVMTQATTSESTTDTTTEQTATIDQLADSTSQLIETTDSSKETNSSSRTETEVIKEETTVTKPATTTTEETTSESTTTSTTEASHPRQKRMIQATGTEVTSWEELQQALQDRTITEIKVTNDLIANTPGATINHTVSVDFDGHQVDLQDKFWQIGSSYTLTLSNLQFTGTTGVLAKGSGKLSLTGTIATLAGNTAGIAAMPAGTVEMIQLTMNYDRGANFTPTLVTRSLTISNKSKITIDAGKVFQGNKAVIDGESEVTTNSYQDGAEGHAWDFTGTLNVQGTSTLTVNGDLTTKTGNGGLLTFKGSSSQLVISGDSTFNAHSKNSTVVSMPNDYSSFNVTGSSSVNLVQDDDSGNVLGTTINLGNATNMSFSVDDHSQVVVNKNGGSAAAVRMVGSESQFSIQGSSEMYILNAGNGSPADPGADGRNQGLQFIQSGTGKDTPAVINIRGDNSILNILAKNGAAADFANTNYININSGNGTYFIAKGRTLSGSKGILSTTGKLSIRLDKVKSFDLQNNRSGGGYLVNGNQASSFTTTSQNNTTFYIHSWLQGTNLEGRPKYIWDADIFQFYGENLKSFSSSTNIEMNDTMGEFRNGLLAFARISVGSTSPELRVDELRTPTNADKFIYAHASVSVGKGGWGADEKEVHLKIGIFDETGKQVSVVEGSSLGSGISVYGEQARTGMFKIPVPDGKFLTAGYSVKILAAWSGYDGKNWLTKLPDSNFLQDSVKVVDVTPPLPTQLKDDQTSITTGTKTISGSGEVGATVTLTVNGKQVANTVTIDSTGKYTVSLPDGLKMNDTIQVFLRDQAGLAAIVGPPETNNTVGNISPAKELVYHDAVFPPATMLTVKSGSLKLTHVPTTIAFGEQAVTNKTQTYQPSVEGELAISDTRGPQKAPWQLKLTEMTGLHSTDNDLSGQLTYQNDQKAVSLNNEAQVVEVGELTEDGERIVSEAWNKDHGLSLTVPVAKQQVGDYQGKLAWSLEDVPANK